MAVDSGYLSRTLRDEAATMHAFVGLLRAEQRSLVDGEVEKLTSYADPKTRYLSELSDLAEGRLALLRAAGRAPDRTGMESLLREYARGTPQLGMLWTELLTITQDAQHLNATNGELIATRLKLTQQALDALFAAAQIPRTYAADGSTTGFYSGNALGVA